MAKVPSRYKRTLPLGKDMETGESVSLSAERLETHMHILGPPGEGKTRLLLWIFEQSARNPNATIVLVNPKGKLGRMARDWAIGHGQGKRLVWTDPGDDEVVFGYNPLSPNPRPIATHVKTVREAIRSAWGQASFDQTPQLARLLYLALAVARSLGGTLDDALRLLQSGAVGSKVREVLTASLARGSGDNDLRRFLIEALTWFDSLGERRQEELGASTLARLEPFVADPTIRRIITQPKSLDIGELIAGHKILIVNLEIGRPLGIDDVKLLGRFIVNDVLNNVFSRPESPNEPIYLILDEVQNFATHDLCSALDMGRELGLHCILAHQTLGQLRQEDQSGFVYHSVKKCALTKCYFGGLDGEDLELTLRDACIDKYDPYKVKDELTSLSLDPIESRREVVTEGWNLGASRGTAQGRSLAVSRAQASGASEIKGKSTTESESCGTTFGSGLVTGTHSGLGNGETLLPSGEIIETQHGMDGTSEAEIDSQTDSYSSTYTVGRHRSKSTQESQSSAQALGVQEVRNLNLTNGISRTSASNPFYEYKKEYRVSSRTFVSEQEFLTGMFQKVQNLPQGHIFLKIPKKTGRFIALPWVRTPWISERSRKAGLEKVFAQPFYSKREKGSEKLLPDNFSTVDRFPPAESSIQELNSPELNRIRERRLPSVRTDVPKIEDDDNFSGPEVPLKVKRNGKRK
jgi:hypothetical protein